MVFDMYAEQILDLWKNPLNKKDLGNSTHIARGTNPLCGDNITLKLLIKENIVCDVGFIGEGCAISQAAASLLTEEIKGKSLEDISFIDEQRILELIGVQISSSRMKCALLPLTALQEAIS